MNSTGVAMKIIAVLACPYGSVFTYLAAAALKNEGQKRDIELFVETQGNMGTQYRADPSDIKQADLIILTKDKAINDENRFKGKLTLFIHIRDALEQPEEVLHKVVQMLDKNG